MNDKQINTLLAAAIVTTGVVIAVKNHKRDGFWKGALAAFLVAGLSVTVHRGLSIKKA